MKKIITNIAKIVFLIIFCTTSFFAVSPVSSAENSYPNDLKLLSHNVYMLSQNLYPNWGQVKRADLIAEADYIKGHDVVILNEIFDNEASIRLLNGIANQYPYQTPVLGRSKSGWDSTQGSYSDLTPEDGGVAIVSKWPIEEKIQYVYSQGCGADWNANKGFVYVKMKKNDRPYHIIGTHMQSDDERCSAGQPAFVRKSQMNEMKQFIANKNIPINEVIFIGGDFNVIKDTPEYDFMLTHLNVKAPSAYTGFASTWDPTTNGIANYNYPDLGPQYLDYIFVEKGHAQPSNWYIKALYVKSPEWSVTSWWKTYTYNDYSDHYPVAGFATP